MTDTASTANFEPGYLDRVAEQVRRLERYADNNRQRFLWLRGALIVISAALPALTAMGLWIPSTIAATIVAILAGVEAQLQPGERWQHFALRRLIWNGSGGITNADNLFCMVQVAALPT